MCDNSLHNSQHNRILKRIREIKYSNEILCHGISELEALFLRIQSGKQSGKNVSEAIAKESASTLDRKNHCLAHSINSALKELESTLRKEIEDGNYVRPETIHEFTSVLRESIKIFHEFRLVQDGYNEMLVESENKSYTKLSSREKTKFLSNQQLRRIMKMLCVCGTTRDFVN